jgi:signal transduction histidine kinase
MAVIQYILITLSITQARDFQLTYNEVRNILLVILILQACIVIFLISYLPTYLKKMLSGIENIISEVARGNYNQDIDIENYKKSYDKELVDVVEILQKMLTIIMKFDSLKKDKIQEQRGRILALLNLTENGFLIVNKKGDIVYVNDFIKEHFPNMSEDINLLEANFGLEIDNNIKKYVSSIIKSQSKNRQQRFYMASMKRHIILRSELVRDANGNFIGAVIGIYNLIKKETEKGKEEEDSQ